MKLNSITHLLDVVHELSEQSNVQMKRIYVCSTGCRALGAQEVVKTLREEVSSRAPGVKVVEVGCMGLCAKAPVLAIYPPGLFYGGVKPNDVPEIVERSLLKEEVIERLCVRENGRAFPLLEEIPFYKGQMRIVLSNCGRVDPRRIEDSLGQGAYSALAKVLREMTPEQVIEEVTKSGLRGRGGAGFPTGMKWSFCRKAKGEPKYLVCNGDEGDPGAFMDRAVLEGDPHRVLEGMLISAYAIGATHGYVYVRAEYPIAVEHITLAINQAREWGLLGENILGTGLSFDIIVKEGAGAFVCGEETALIASIEGKRGMPRPRPPFPAQEGLFGKPTTINNVETFANLPPIILKGADWYRQIGTEGSKGTKIFALAGKVRNTGLVEVPMGATLRQIVFDIGGGFPRGREFKAAQMGGPSGGCVPRQYLDLPIDYESVKEIGAIMGSGGLIIMDNSTCMVDVARYFLEFVQNESCGKCTPCRLGTKRMLDILTAITRGEGKMEDLDKLQELAETIKDSSLCGLGQTAPNPVLTTLRYFRDEYEAHILHKHCPAARCEALVRAPCEHRCPAHINVPHYVALVAMGEYERAVDVIRRRLPFAWACGRMCPHPCETLCRRGELDEPIAIRDLKRYATEHDRRKLVKVSHLISPPTGKKVLIVGAGPAGLSAAYFLAMMGHKVTVYEASEVVGGIMATGIPAYRLPPQVLKKDIDYIKKFGVRIRLRRPVKNGRHLRKLMRGYDAAFLAIGAQVNRKLDIPGEELEGVVDALTFLRRANLGQQQFVGKRVVVIGGGDVAMDSARVALRLGAETVTVLYRRSREEMPAIPEEIAQAEEEGVRFRFLVAPKAVVGKNGRMQGVECIAMKLGPADSSGRRRPIPVPGSEFFVESDMLISAVSQETDLAVVTGAGIAISEQQTISVDPVTLKTNLDGVFAGGDCVTGAATVVQAVGQGQAAAVAIDRYLGGKGELPPSGDPLVEDGPRCVQAGDFSPRPRAKMPTADPKERRRDFREVLLGFREGEAEAEAQRCLRCDLESKVRRANRASER